jgi:hypothetical protein
LPRKYKPTGKPAGRPPKLENRFDPTKLEEMVKTVTQMAVTVTGNKPERLDAEALGKLVDETALLNGRKGGLDNVARKVTPMTKEELNNAAEAAKANIAFVIANFHHNVPDLLNALALYNPEKALKLYVELLEYHTPKLARVEQAGTVEHQHFVHVESREERPAPINVTPGR